jgi:putative SOS response-associated peptidase YedK
MCGRFTLAKQPRQISDRFRIHIPDSLAVSVAKRLPAFNAAPGQQLPLVTQAAPDTLSLAQWGLPAPWKSSGGLVINARSETLEKKKMFSGLLAGGRCLIPADGFYEWQKQQGKKQPFRFVQENGELFAFAGLWGFFPMKDQADIPAFTILTTAANELISDIHDRMPVILPREMEQTWLSASLAEADLAEMLQPFPAARMRTYMVSPSVNKATINHAGLIEPWQDNTLTLDI